MNDTTGNRDGATNDGESSPLKPYTKPTLHRHGTIAQLTTWLQRGRGGPPDTTKGPPPGVKYVGSQDLSRSGQGT